MPKCTAGIVVIVAGVILSMTLTGCVRSHRDYDNYRHDDVRHDELRPGDVHHDDYRPGDMHHDVRPEDYDHH